MSVLLKLEKIEAQYGASKVLHGVDMEVAEGGITTLLGANGAGKTTTLRSICNMIVKTTGGQMVFNNQDISKKTTEEIVSLGIGHVPDGRGTFVHLTVEENLKIGAYTRKDTAGVSQDFERAYRYFPVLLERRNQQAGTLSGGEQQMLAIARALMIRPKLLILDEPSFGLAPLIVKEIFKIMKKINQEEGVTMLLVEQNASLALDLAEDAYLIETGKVVITGKAQDIKNDDSVRRSYLGY